MRRFRMAELGSFHGKESNTQNSGDAENTYKENLTGCRPGRDKFRLSHKNLAGEAVFLRIEQLGEARVFLEESEILVVARVIAVLGAQLNGDLQIGQSGIGFAGEAIERSQRIVNMVSFGRGLASFVETFAGIIPTADVHHRHAALVVLIGGVGISL